MSNIIVVRHFDDVWLMYRTTLPSIWSVVQEVQETVESLRRSRRYLSVFTRTGINPWPTSKQLSEKIAEATAGYYMPNNNKENIMIDRIPSDWNLLQKDLVEFTRVFPPALVCIAWIKWIAGLSNIGMRIDGFSPELSLPEMEKIIPPGFVTTFELF